MIPFSNLNFIIRIFNGEIHEFFMKTFKSFLYSKFIYAVSFFDIFAVLYLCELIFFGLELSKYLNIEIS